VPKILLDSKNKSNRVEIVRVGKFERRFEEDLEITLFDLEKMKQNFESNARRLELNGQPALPFNFSHDQWGEAAGWITSLEIDKDSQSFDALFASVDWTSKGSQKIRDNEFKFVSSEFTHNFKDPETGKIYDIILGGAALTNVPFIRDMEAVNLLSEKGNGQRTSVSLSLSGDKPDVNLKIGANMPKEFAKKFKKLSPEDQKEFLAECKLKTGDDKKLSEALTKAQGDLKLSQKEVETLKADMSGSDEVSDKLKLAEGKIEDQGKKITSLIKDMAKKEKTAEFDQMLSAAKVCEAQRESFMSTIWPNSSKTRKPSNWTNPEADQEATN